MKYYTKQSILVLAFVLTVFVFSACANPDQPSSLPEINGQGSNTPTEATQDLLTETTAEETTEEILEEITNFPVLTDAQKTLQRTYHDEYNRENIYVLHWDMAGTTHDCPYTAEEILSNIALGDNIMDVYERIGYPTYRDTPSSFLSGRPLDLYFMTYTTTDGDVIDINIRLAGCNEDDYRYVVTSYSSLKETVPYTKMDFDTKVRLQVIPVFMAVEQVGVDYLLEKEIITPYEATLYEDEEAVYQEWLARQDVTE